VDLRESFLRDVADHPDDNTPRRIFADWLLDQGGPDDADHGRLILFQCDRASSAEEEALLARLTTRWQERFAPLRVRQWQRGFVTDVGLPGLSHRAAEAYHRLARWPEFLAVRTVAVFHPEGQPYLAPLHEDDLQQLLGSSYWHVEEFLARGETYLDYFEMLSPALREEGLRRLCRSPAARTLRRLDLSTNFSSWELRQVLDHFRRCELTRLDTLLWDFDAYREEDRLTDEQMRRLANDLGCRVVADGRTTTPGVQ
jgi:uncharacterized protein (TIGR02996 family)